MALIRRNGHGHANTRASLRAQKRARWSALRFILEILEARVLLSGGKIGQQFPLLSQDLPVTRASVAPLSQSSSVVHHEAIALLASSNGTGPDGPPILVRVQPNTVSLGGPPTFVVLYPAISAGSFSSSSSLPEESSSNVEIVVDPRETVAGAAELAANSTSDAGPPPSGLDVSIATAGQSSVGTDADNTTAVWTVTRSTSNPGDDDDSPLIPDAKHVEVDGSFGPNHTLQSFQIPVGPLTSAVRLSLSGSAGSIPGDTPVFTQMFFVNSAGGTLESISPDWGQTPNSPQDLTVSVHDAPVGAHLLVQIGAVSPEVPASASGVPGTAASWSAPYVLNVQRQDDQNGAPQSGVAPQGPVAVGTLVFASSSQGGGASLIQAPFATSDATMSAGSIGQEPIAAGPGPVGAGQLPATSGEFTDGVSTGPFASRTAGPLGPILAASEADLAPPVDRHERGLFQEIDSTQSEDAGGDSEGRYELTGRGSAVVSPVEPRAAESNSMGGTVVAVSHGGGFPLMVTSLGNQRRTDRAALLASLPSTRDLETAADRSTALAEAAAAERTHASSDDSEVPDFVKAAFSLALGLGLTSSPLFPDLLSRAPARLPKWLRHLIARPAGRRREDRGR